MQPISTVVFAGNWQDLILNSSAVMERTIAEGLGSPGFLLRGSIAECLEAWIWPYAICPIFSQNILLYGCIPKVILISSFFNS